MSDEFIIETRNLTKAYRNGPLILDGLDIEVPRGSIFGLLGRNGAGKTTTIRILMGLLKADGGMTRVLGDGSSPLRVETLRRIGYLSQDQKFFSWMSLEGIESFTSSFYPSWDEGYAKELAKKLGLPRGAPLGALSRGERQKAGLLLALAPRPELLVLDEPAASLDTVVRREFLESILDLLGREGITVLVSSQILTDIERVADRIGILSGGRMLVDAPLDDLKESIKRIRITFPEEAPASLGLPGAIRTVRRGREALVTVRNFTPALAAELENRFPGKVDVLDVDLEEIFIELVG